MTLFLIVFELNWKVEVQEISAIKILKTQLKTFIDFLFWGQPRQRGRGRYVSMLVVHSALRQPVLPILPRLGLSAKKLTHLHSACPVFLFHILKQNFLFELTGEVI